MSISISEYESDVKLSRMVHLFVQGTVMLSHSFVLFFFLSDHHIAFKGRPHFLRGILFAFLLNSDNC